MTADFYTQELVVSSVLLWYFNHSECEVGITSSWNSLTSGNQMNGKSFHDPYTDRRLSAISKRRKVEQAFYKLEKDDRLLLSANFGAWQPIPAMISNVFTKQSQLDLSLTVCYLWQLDLKDLIKLCNLKCQHKTTLEQNQLIFQLQNQAKGLYQKAIINAYHQLKDIRL